MTVFQQLQNEYGHDNCGRIEIERLEQLRDDLKKVLPSDILSAEDGKSYIDLLRKFREAVARVDKLHGDNYPQLLNSLLSVGEDGLYSNSLRFIFELIQNVDDCDYESSTDCKLDMRFDFDKDEIILAYNEVGFTPFNVFAITGIAEAAKNISSEKNQIGEKGIGFKSVFGVANRVWIRSGWFSFELHKNNFTIPFPIYKDFHYCNGTQMTLYVPGRAKQIYNEIKGQYCKRDALFSRNPLLFLNQLTSLRFYYDESFRYMEFRVSRSDAKCSDKFQVERDVSISVDLRDHENGLDTIEKHDIHCTRYTYYVTFSKAACRSRYGENTKVGQSNGKAMIICAVIPDKEYITEVGNGQLYSFLPTQLKLTVPIVCHVPFKLDASREFVDPQDNNIWFKEACNYLSELMDKLFLDYSHVTKGDIVRYIPDKSKSLFAINNGKEKCLTSQSHFNGAHYLDLPIFYTIDGFKKSDEIFCFSENENIEEPEKVYRLMGYHRSLFISPIPVTRFSITVVTGVKHKMFKKALDIADRTSDILDYLDSVNYNYPEQLIRKLEPIKISQAQLHIIINHKELSKAFQSLSCHDIRINRRFRLEITDADVQTITDLLDDEFEMSDIPKAVRNYMEYCQNKCICFDESSELYMPCYNAILISSQKPLSSFLSFCRDIDPNDPFTTRITWREKSSELNKYVEDATISESEYMRVLRQIRLSIRDSLGKEGYRSYLDIILKSGTDRGRFIQELLQNADDCFYEQDITPTFSLSVNGSTIVTEYNEIGFTRANIRSITAIGESTKKKLLTHRSSSIGEKGVGFKTIFAIASKVTIHSGDYHFSLSDKEPTIPKLIGEAIEATPGTKMEIALKNNEVLHSFKEKEILELCLCLRNLKKLTIGKHTILISDTDDKRTITIGTRNYSFKRFYHDFDITDESAIEERKNGSREISTNQQIVCYVPEFSVEKNYDFPLYCGLPTKHKIRIPMAIDAPFSLTTSREEIETEGSKWNDIIRREMYVALMEVIDSLKTDERSNIFKYLKFVPRFQGALHVYVNDTFDNKYLNGYDLLTQLRSKEIIPTYNRDIFAIPIQNTAHRYPEAAIYIITKLSLSEYEEINSSSIIDIGSSDNDAVLNALSCEEADYSMALPILFKYAERFIRDEVFRNAFYEYISEAPADYTPKIKELHIIPVYGIESNVTEYIAWKEKSIYVKRNETRSGTDHYILNEHYMPKSLCEKIYSDNINEWSHEIERVKYNDRLETLLCEEDDISAIYRFLLSEYRSGRLLKNGSFKILSSYNVPLKNQCNEITCKPLFVCDLSNYFTTEMILGISVHDECLGLAKDIGIESLSCIHYEDIQYHKELTADDIEELIDEPNHYFLNYEELLRGFYRDGLLSEALLQEYELDYLSYGGYDATDYTYDFPSEQVENRTALASHIKKLCKTPVRIITVEEMCKVQKIKTYDDRVYPYDRSYSRNIILNTYSPEGSRDLCFCQMCLKPKPKVYIEVNSIDILPEFFFSQLRLSLCLECSKRFEALRRNEPIRKAFIRCIKEYVITDEGTVEIPIGNFDSITFTAKHLAEIQEIFRQIPPKHK